MNLIKDEPITIVTKNGMAIRFDSKEIGATSRATSGVKGVGLNEGDEVVSTLVVRHDTDELAVFAKNGLGKKFALSELPIQKRAGKGLQCYKPSDSTGPVVAAALVEEEDQVLICGDKSSICISAKDIPTLSRASIGNALLKDNKVVSVSKV